MRMALGEIQFGFLRSMFWWCLSSNDDNRNEKTKNFETKKFFTSFWQLRPTQTDEETKNRKSRSRFILTFYAFVKQIEREREKRNRNRNRD